MSLVTPHACWHPPVQLGRRQDPTTPPHLPTPALSGQAACMALRACNGKEGRALEPGGKRAAAHHTLYYTTLRSAPHCARRARAAAAQHTPLGTRNGLRAKNGQARKTTIIGVTQYLHRVRHANTGEAAILKGGGPPYLAAPDTTRWQVHDWHSMQTVEQGGHDCCGSVGGEAVLAGCFCKTLQRSGTHAPACHLTHHLTTCLPPLSTRTVKQRGKGRHNTRAAGQAANLAERPFRQPVVGNKRRSISLTRYVTKK